MARSSSWYQGEQEEGARGSAWYQGEPLYKAGGSRIHRIQHFTIPYNTISYLTNNVLQYHTIQYLTIPYNILLYHINHKHPLKKVYFTENFLDNKLASEL